MTQMADILLLPAAEQDSSLWLLISGLVVIVIACLLLWRYLTQPLNRLQRHILQGKLTVREAAHALAHLISPANDLQQEVDQLRFQRRSPDESELLALINKVKHGR